MYGWGQQGFMRDPRKSGGCEPSASYLRCSLLHAASLDRSPHCVRSDVWASSAAVTKSDYIVRGISRATDQPHCSSTWHYLNSTGFVAGCLPPRRASITIIERLELNASWLIGTRAADWHG